MRKLRDIVLEQQPLIMNETASVRAACERMRDTQAGSVLVTSDTGRLVGIFTGRDAVCRVLAEGRDAVTTTLDQVMTPKPDHPVARPDCDRRDSIMVAHCAQSANPSYALRQDRRRAKGVEHRCLVHPY